MPDAAITCSVLYEHWLPKKVGHEASTFNRKIRTREKMMTADLLAHEVVHILQEWQLGKFKFWFLYLKDQLLRGYEGNRFEKIAYKYQGDPEWVKQFIPITEEHPFITIQLDLTNYPLINA
jgi:hypothetical protein